MRRYFAELSLRARRLLSCLLVCTSALIVALPLAGCGGGGGGGGGTSPVPPPPVVARADLSYGYFGTVGNQIAETADHVTFVHVGDWGDWDTPAGREAITQAQIAMLQEAQARGVHDAWVMVGYLVFDSAYHYRGIAELAVFRQRIEALGLAPMVKALYPVDEPELHALGGETLTAILGELRVTWPGPKLAVIYGDHGAFPAIDAYDIVGMDNYGVFAPIAPVHPGQSVVLVPGGSDPWRDNPQPWLDEAESNPNIVGIIAFVWFDSFNGLSSTHGIRSNGMAAAYTAVGRKVKAGT
jgi:hypothetical protein